MYYNILSVNKQRRKLQINELHAIVDIIKTEH